MRYIDFNGIDLYQMQICVTVAKYQSMTKAATVLHTSQPALSKKITQLEEQLGIILFIRGKNTNLRPTPAGQFLNGEWQRLLNRFMASYDKAAQIQECKSERLIVATTPSAATDLIISPVVSEFCANYPDIEVRIENCSLKDSKELLSAGMVDIVLVNSFITDFFDTDDFDWQIVLTCPWSVGMLKTNPLAKNKAVTYKDLKTQDLVLPQSDLFIQKTLALCEAHGFTPSISYYSNYFHGISFCISNNNEVYFTDRYLQDYYNNSCVCFDLPDTTSGVVMAVRKHEVNAYVEAFKRTALAKFQAMNTTATN